MKHLAIIISLVVFVTVGITVTNAWYQPKPTPTLSPCEGNGYSWMSCITPTVTPTVTPTITPEVSPNATPSATEAPTAPPAGHSDGLSDHRSDGLCSAPPCITPGVVVPTSAPETGRGEYR